VATSGTGAWEALQEFLQQVLTHWETEPTLGLEGFLQAVITLGPLLTAELQIDPALEGTLEVKPSLESEIDIN
jgi:hypothetical protein